MFLSLKRHWIETRDSLSLAGPLMLSQVSFVVSIAIDNLMLGRIGAEPLAAVAFARSIYFVYMILGFSVGDAVSPLVAHRRGAAETQQCGDILRHGLALTVLSALAMIALIRASLPFLHYFRQPPVVTELAHAYLKVAACALLPMMLAHSFRQFSEGLGKTFPPMLILISGLGVQGFCSWALIFGRMGLPAMGPEGAALSLLITQTYSAAVLAVYALSDGACRIYHPGRWLGAWQWSHFRPILRLGLPGALQRGFEVSAFSFAAVMMGWLGPIVLAAHEIAINLAHLTFMFATGMSFASGIRVGNARGRGRMRAARRAGLNGFALIAAAMSIFGITFLSARHALPRLYIQDPRVVQACAGFLVVAALFQVFDGIQAVALGALRGLEDVKTPTLITLLAYWLLSLPLGYLLAFPLHMGGLGVWCGLMTGLATAAVLLAWRFHRMTRA